MPGPPVGRRVPPARPQKINAAAWEAALNSYLSICRVARAHEDQSLKPALDRMAAGLARFGTLAAPCGQRLEDPVSILKAYEADLRAKGLGQLEIRVLGQQDVSLRELRTTAALMLRRRRMQRALYQALEIERIEGEAQKLLQERLQRVATLAATPVVDFAAFTLKLEILFAEVFQHDADFGGLIAELVADVRSLHKLQGAQQR